MRELRLSLREETLRLLVVSCVQPLNCKTISGVY